MTFLCASDYDDLITILKYLINNKKKNTMCHE